VHELELELEQRPAVTAIPWPFRPKTIPGLLSLEQWNDTRLFVVRSVILTYSCFHPHFTPVLAKQTPGMDPSLKIQAKVTKHAPEPSRSD